jgi:ribosomal protein L11 methyltransferase
MASLQLNIEAKEDQQEILIGYLSDLGAEGFEQTEKDLIAYFNENNFNSYDVNEVLKDYTFHTNTVQDQNWNAVWESNFSPVVVDDFCAVRAEFHEPISSVEHEILITPKMSFGTGHHATTYMMIQQMRDIDFIGKSVFDFGTGTGILAILAEKLGAYNISAIDVDDWSLRNSLENIERNNCSKVCVSLSSKLPDQKFDVILANINKNVILSYLTQLNCMLHAKSKILFSGLLVNDENDILEACESLDIQLKKKLTRSNWISLLCAKRK